MDIFEIGISLNYSLYRRVIFEMNKSETRPVGDNMWDNGWMVGQSPATLHCRSIKLLRKEEWGSETCRGACGMFAELVEWRLDFREVWG